MMNDLFSLINTGLSPDSPGSKPKEEKKEKQKDEEKSHEIRSFRGAEALVNRVYRNGKDQVTLLVFKKELKKSLVFINGAL